MSTRCYELEISNMPEPTETDSGETLSTVEIVMLTAVLIAIAIPLLMIVAAL
jgi:hypothetical protein